MKRGNFYRYIENVVTLELDSERCIGCGICTLVCPHQVFLIKEGKAQIALRDNCMECSACVRNCPVDALYVEQGEGCVRAIIHQLLGREGDCC